jgi:hypothetical protein
MNRPFLVCAFFAVAATILGAQEASPSSPYQGVSNPPADDAIVTTSEPQAKPPAGHPADVTPPATAQQQQMAPQPAASSQAGASPAEANLAPVGNDGTDGGIVQVAPSSSGAAEPGLTERSSASDPDGDIVHPRPLAPGELGEGTQIRVRLLNDLSSTLSQQGQAFRSRVASDVFVGGQVLIPTGAEIDGKVVDVSSGHFGGHGSLLLRPETVILPDGSRFKLHASVTGTPGSHTRVGAEGVIGPDSRVKRDSLEYGGAVGAGAITGAYLGGPVGALAGSLVGAGVVTAHLLVNHPQAHLDEGTVLILSLTERMHLVPADARRN